MRGLVLVGKRIGGEGDFQFVFRYFVLVSVCPTAQLAKLVLGALSWFVSVCARKQNGLDMRIVVFCQFLD